MESNNDMNTLDEKMKALLLSKGEHVIVSVYDSDQSHKNRKNSKRAKCMEKIINDGGFEYKRISKPPFPNGEVQVFFVVYGNTEKFKSIVEENRNAFHVVNYYDDLSKILENVEFYHPCTKSEKAAYQVRNEIILENLFEPPEKVGNWKIKSCYAEPDHETMTYLNSGRVCTIAKESSCKEQCSYRVFIGTYIPCGATLADKKVQTLADAFNLMEKL